MQVAEWRLSFDRNGLPSMSKYCMYSRSQRGRSGSCFALSPYSTDIEILAVPFSLGSGTPMLRLVRELHLPSRVVQDTMSPPWSSRSIESRPAYSPAFHRATSVESEGMILAPSAAHSVYAPAGSSIFGHTGYAQRTDTIAT